MKQIVPPVSAAAGGMSIGLSPLLQTNKLTDCTDHRYDIPNQPCKETTNQTIVLFPDAMHNSVQMQIVAVRYWIGKTIYLPADHVFIGMRHYAPEESPVKSRKDRNPNENDKAGGRRRFLRGEEDLKKQCFIEESYDQLFCSASLIFGSLRR